MPVSESISLPRRTSATYEHQGHQNQSDDTEDLDGSKPEFCFTIDFDGEAVEGEDDDDGQGDPDGNMDGRLPVLDDQRGGCNLGRYSDGENIPVHPAHCKTQTP